MRLRYNVSSKKEKKNTDGDLKATLNATFFSVDAGFLN